MTYADFITIDLEGIDMLLAKQDHKSDKVAEFIDQLWEASSKSGFFYVKNHGINQEEIDRMFYCANEFFSEPLEIKQQYFDENSRGSLGYSQIGNEKLADNIPDHKEMLNYKTNMLDSINFPLVYEKNKEKVNLFLQSSWRLTKTILTGFALSMGLDPDYFCQAHVNELQTESYYRIIHYPPVKDNGNNALRAGRHSDYSTITLLFHETTSYEKRQISTGLQACMLEKDAEGLEIWKDVPAKEGCIIINIGEFLAFWTEGRLHSPVHRVIVPEGDISKKSRYAMTYFIEPNTNFPIHPIKSDIPAPLPAKEVIPGVYKASFGQSDFFYGETAEIYIKRRYDITI